MASINSVEKGEIKVDGTKYNFDIWIFSDGRVMQRDTTLSKNNVISMDEISVILDNSPDLFAIVLGTGQETFVSVDPETLKNLAKKKIPVWDYKTDEAVAVFNEQAKQDKKVAAIIHLN